MCHCSYTKLHSLCITCVLLFAHPHMQEFYMCKFIFFINNIVAINFTMRCLLIVENWIGIVANLCFIILVDVCSLKDEMPSSLRNGPNQAISHVGAMALLYYHCKLYSSEITTNYYLLLCNKVSYAKCTTSREDCPCVRS